MAWCLPFSGGVCAVGGVRVCLFFWRDFWCVLVWSHDVLLVVGYWCPGVEEAWGSGKEQTEVEGLPYDFRTAMRAAVGRWSYSSTQSAILFGLPRSFGW